MLKLNNKAFTLVELIVVIVILSILATIAFLSFSSQSASARDSARLSDMTNISKGLSVFNAISGKLPMPDSSITLSVSGNTIGYQGYTGINTLNMIKLSKGGKDPLDSNTFYTYSTNASQNMYELLGFLEDGNNSSLSYDPFSCIQTNADSSSYSGRFLITRGDGIGVILSTGSLLPIQASGNSIDMAYDTGYYITQFDSKDSAFGTGGTLFTNIYNRRADLLKNKAIAKYDVSLMGYWDFEEGNGALAKDLSSKSNSGILSGPTLPKWTSSKTGKALSLDALGGYIDVPTSPSISTFSGITLNVWVNFNNTSGNQIIIRKNTNIPSTNYSVYQIDAVGGNFRFVMSTEGTAVSTAVSTGNIISGIWYNVTGTWDGNKMSLYINGNMEAQTSKTGSLNTSNQYSLVFGGLEGGVSTLYNGYLDEIRINNRALAKQEILAIYKANK